MKEALIFIGILSIVLFFIITAIRIVMTIVLLYLIKKYTMLINLIKQKKQDDYIPSSRNDILYRDKNIEQQKEKEAIQQLQNVQRLPKNIDEENFDLESFYNKKEIVGIVKPIGYWTSLILGQKVTYLIQHAETLKSQNDVGYWVNMLHAKDISKGRSRGR